ncbi:PREDICTED: uncharacterized protein LOC105363136 [Ceratosolen solmsi marchali]|uniref:Uncharacterized protein LOC105363136 n=1 Tax=Ceratosolen solmsi marchali TaxID=326594 RepID=A0AAJ7DWK1_9HYME|nr:PREDICTED: uncharacterized protein LOC105363136 [Ceratosolen solmsi marchali]
MDDLGVRRRRPGSKSRVTSMFQRISWCGCINESRVSSRPKSPTLGESSWRSALIVDDEEYDDVARYFDLSSVKFIDEDAEDEVSEPKSTIAPICRLESYDGIEECLVR